MADARSLLKAKRQEVRINHPYASYNTSGQLKCSVCAAWVKHSSAWEGHLGSKAHRTNIIRLREEEKQKGQSQRQAKGRVQEEINGLDEGQTAPGPTTSISTPKRKTYEDDKPTDHDDKRRKIESFPSDFFSDPYRAPVLLSEGEDSDVEDSNAPTGAQSAVAPITAVDLEYERFQRELLSTVDPAKRYNQATIVAEPVAASTYVSSFPIVQAEVAVDISEENKEEELRQKREQDERELIMDRLLEEERAQEDADTRVLLLKNRIEILRKKRLEAKTNKSQIKENS